MTFSNDPDAIEPIQRIMMESRENVVNYMDPLALNMIFGYNNHYGPGSCCGSTMSPGITK